MEFSSVWYLSFWSIINQASLVVAVQVAASAKLYLELPQFIQYSHVLMFLAAYFSNLYAFLVRPRLEPDLTIERVNGEAVFFSLFLSLVAGIPTYSKMIPKYLRLPIYSQIYLLLMVAIVVPTCLFYLSIRYIKSKEIGKFSIGFGGPLLVYPSHTLCYVSFIVSLFIVTSLAFSQDLSFEAKQIVQFVEYLFTFFVVALTLVTSDAVFESLARMLENSNGKMMKMLRIPFGLLGYVLSQYSIQEKSVPLLVMLFSFSVSWLANLAMVRPSTDLGIFSFFIGAILDSAISLFRLGKFTWIVCAGCGLLMLLQQKLNSVTLRYPPPRRTALSKWRSLETEIDRTSASLINYYKNKWIGKGSEGHRKLSDDQFSNLPSDFFFCAARLSMEKMAGKEEESKEKLIDKLLHFTLHLLEQNEEIIEGEEISRDEQIHMLCHLYFQLRNVEEKGKDEQIRSCQIAICSCLVICRLLQKIEIENENEKTKEARIIRLCHLNLGQLCRKMENTRMIRKNKKVKIDEIGLSLPGLIPAAALRS